MALTLSGGFLLQWPIGLLSDRYSRHSVLPVIALCVAALSVSITFITGRSTGAVIALAVLWGAFSFTLYPLSVALVNDYVDSSQFVQVSAGLLLASSLGMIAGSLVALGQLMAVMGAGGLFWTVVATSFGLAYLPGYVGVGKGQEGPLNPRPIRFCRATLPMPRLWIRVAMRCTTGTGFRRPVNAGAEFRHAGEAGSVESGGVGK
ncbi:Major facilitator superfamily MFS_1 [Nitrococcus mobilis Nb-231]|uniref:Major facilitator superfamily MFS_1 n=2 Tax=Nitrococcus mobilis TaxID=35797 RepID=A4BPK6_9GAMM|nr:Major facilitator superfamily MFS_1 [Nitrococcus mobilis Nb-231]